MQDFKKFMAEQELGASAQDAIRVIKQLNGRLTTAQWDRLIQMINTFVSENTNRDNSYSVGWNLAGTSHGPPDQPPKQEPRTLQP